MTCRLSIRRAPAQANEASERLADAPPEAVAPGPFADAASETAQTPSRADLSPEAAESSRVVAGAAPLGEAPEARDVDADAAVMSPTARGAASVGAVSAVSAASPLTTGGWSADAVHAATANAEVAAATSPQLQGTPGAESAGAASDVEDARVAREADAAQLRMGETHAATAAAPGAATLGGDGPLRAAQDLAVDHEQGAGTATGVDSTPATAHDHDAQPIVETDAAVGDSEQETAGVVMAEEARPDEAESEANVSGDESPARSEMRNRAESGAVAPGRTGHSNVDDSEDVTTEPAQADGDVAETESVAEAAEQEMLLAAAHGALTPAYLQNVVEAALLAAGRPLSVNDILALFDEPVELGKADVRASLEEVRSTWQGRALELVEVRSGFRLQVRKEYSGPLAGLWVERPPRYSRALLETLALIAYRQPISRGEIEDVRGVSVSANIVRTLQERDWIRVVGHRDVPGKPALFGTTRAFLDDLGLPNLESLPPLSDLKDIESMNADLFSDLAPPAVAGSDAVPAQVEGPDESSAGVDGGDEPEENLPVASDDDLPESRDAASDSEPADGSGVEAAPIAATRDATAVGGSGDTASSTGATGTHKER